MKTITDKQRLDWLEKYNCEIFHSSNGKQTFINLWIQTNHDDLDSIIDVQGTNLRDLIDKGIEISSQKNK
jgi:hypothetical protein